MLSHSVYTLNHDAKWVTFVHGAGGSSSIWFKQIRDFKKHFNVLLLDLRGHGNSKPKFKDSFKDDYTFDSISNDIIEVLDHEKIEKSQRKPGDGAVKVIKSKKSRVVLGPF